MNDLEIIELFFARDEEAIKQTNVKYGKLCFSIAYNILNNTEDSEECVNDAFLGAWNAIPPARPNNFMAFISKITRNLSLKRLESITRQKRSNAICVSFDELSEILPDGCISDGVSDKDIGKLISDFLKKETSEIRNVFIRKYYFFDSIGDIAQRYDCTESKIKNMLYHTRTKLKKYLIMEGIKI